MNFMGSATTWPLAFASKMGIIHRDFERLVGDGKVAHGYNFRVSGCERENKNTATVRKWVINWSEFFKKVLEQE